MHDLHLMHHAVPVLLISGTVGALVGRYFDRIGPERIKTALFWASICFIPVVVVASYAAHHAVD